MIRKNFIIEMTKNPKIISIIVTYNAVPWLDKCFGSLTNTSQKNHTIIAIDNASSDHTVDALKERFPEVILIESKQNLGFGKANNIGLKKALEADADFVFLLNQDAWIEHDTLEKIIDISLKNPKYGIVSPIHLNNKNSIDSEFLKYCYLNLKSDFTFDSLLSKPLKDIYETSFINAAAWLLTKECLRTNGGFMPIFPHYGEDGNYCERVIHSGLKIGFTPGITIVHDREVKKRRLSFKKKFNHLYVYLLGIFASGKKQGLNNYWRYCLKKLLQALKIFYKQPVILLLIPIALFVLLIKSKQIYLQRKEARKHEPNFLY